MLELMHGQNTIHVWKFRYLKIIGNNYWLAVKNAKQCKHETWATKRNCPKDLYHYSPLPEKSAIRCNVYTFVFCIFYSRMFTCIRSSKNLPGRVNCWISLKFTEKYYKKLSFSNETNPFYVLWFEKFESLISRSRTPKRATLLLFKVS